MQGLLLTKKLAYSKHSAVIDNFGKEFAKTGQVPAKFHKYIIDAFKHREDGDYGDLGVIEKETAKDLLDKSLEFLDFAEEFLKKQGFST